MEISRSLFGPEHPETLGAMGNLAISYFAAGRRGEALKLREEVLTLSRKVSGPEHPETLGAMQNLAFSYADVGRRDEALKLQEEVLALFRKVLGPEHPATLGSMANLAWSLATCPDAAQRDPKRAVELAAQAAKLDPKEANIIGTLGTAQYRAGDHAAAIASLEKALSLRKDEKVGGAYNGLFLAMARWHTGDKDTARKDYERALARLSEEKNPPTEETLRFKEEARALLGEPAEAAGAKGK
jgi:tetratricopeptide (TPR) repeat protein